MIKTASLSRGGFSMKKKIILFVAIFLFLTAVAACLLFMPAKVEGSWELVENPETGFVADTSVKETERVFYVFEKPDAEGKGKWSILFDGGEEHYEYRLINANGAAKINLGSEDLTYVIEGFKLFGTATLTLVYPETADPDTGAVRPALKYVLRQKKAPDYKKMPYGDYETDSRLNGDWATNERFLSYFDYVLPYKETVTFHENGIMTIRYESYQLQIDRIIYYAYSASGATLKFCPVLEPEKERTVTYGFDGEGNLKFINDLTTDSVFADAFFGEVPYYRPDRLLDPPVYDNASGTTQDE